MSIVVRGIVVQMAPANGAVIVYGTDDYRSGATALLVEGYPLNFYDAQGKRQQRRAGFVRKVVDGEPTLVAVFPDVPPGDYSVWGSYSHKTPITVSPGYVAEVDWR